MQKGEGLTQSDANTDTSTISISIIENFAYDKIIGLLRKAYARPENKELTTIRCFTLAAILPYA